MDINALQHPWWFQWMYLCHFSPQLILQMLPKPAMGPMTQLFITHKWLSTVWIGETKTECMQATLTIEVITLSFRSWSGTPGSSSLWLRIYVPAVRKLPVILIMESISASSHRSHMFGSTWHSWSSRCKFIRLERQKSVWNPPRPLPI